MELLLLAAGVIAVVALVAVWVRRRHREVDEVDDDGYEGPPPVHGQAGPH